MKNPWLKKNPLLSMWLSGANAMLGVVRGHLSAEAARQIRTMSRTSRPGSAEVGSRGVDRRSRKRKRSR